jgi:hypothetical protein
MPIWFSRNPGPPMRLSQMSNQPTPKTKDAAFEAHAR